MLLRSARILCAFPHRCALPAALRLLSHPLLLAARLLTRSPPPLAAAHRRPSLLLPSRPCFPLSPMSGMPYERDGHFKLLNARPMQMHGPSALQQAAYGADRDDDDDVDEEDTPEERKQAMKTVRTTHSNTHARGGNRQRAGCIVCPFVDA